MKANELRIGNFVGSLAPETDYCIVESIKLNEVIAVRRIVIGSFSSSWDGGSDIPFIPLTEDWLTKFGFTADDKVAEGLVMGYSLEYMDYGACSNEFVIVQGNEGFFLAEEGQFVLCVYPSSRPFKYVHELQNLYFALTGNELTIKS